MALGPFRTAGEVLQEAAVLAGVAVSLVDPFGSVDANVVQLRLHLARAGRALAADHPWGHLQVAPSLAKTGGVWSLPTGWTDLGGDVLALPDDFVELTPSTSWAQRQPVGGPLSPQAWQRRVAGVLLPTWAEFRADGQRVRFLPTPLADQTVTMEYQSAAWVRPSAQGLGNGLTLGPTGSDTPETNGDYLLLDRDLLVLATVNEWRKQHALPSDDQAVAAAARILLAKQQPAQPLHLARVPAGVPLIGVQNVPEGSWSI